MPGVYEEQINQNGIMPAADRFMAWKIRSDIFKQMTISFGGRFVPAPKSMVAKTGFLDRKAWSDPTHGNVNYGQAVLNQLRDLIDAPV